MDANKNRTPRDGSLAQEPGGLPDSANFNMHEEISPPPRVGGPNPGGKPKSGGGPNNIRETQAWKASKHGVNRVWTNYRNTLAEAFRKMNRSEQEALVQRFCLIITMGVTGIALLLFYPLVPQLVRVFFVPAAGVGAFWAGNRIVTPVVLARLEGVLNRD